VSSARKAETGESHGLSILESRRDNWKLFAGQVDGDITQGEPVIDVGY
jgi:hypothetical protein